MCGLRLHLVCTLGGLPILFALTDAKADGRETLRDMLDTALEVVIAAGRSSAIRTTSAPNSSGTSPSRT